MAKAESANGYFASKQKQKTLRKTRSHKVFETVYWVISNLLKSKTFTRMLGPIFKQINTKAKNLPFH